MKDIIFSCFWPWQYFYIYTLNILMLLIIFPLSGEAANPFLNKNQQAQKYYKAEDYQKSYELFDDSYNKGVAAYRNQDYQTAISEFKKVNNYKNKYNLVTATSWQKI